MIPWNNAKLEPVIITFNRAKYLEKTLAALLEAGLTEMRLHVLDNASTDATEEIVKKFQTQWPNLQYHKNEYNIGGNANIMRSIEMANSEYHWVIGDDDEWMLSNISELVDKLNSSVADIIRLGWLVSEESRGKIVDSEIIRQSEDLFFASVSMISATILRRSLVVKYLRESYANIINFYPQIIPVILSNQNESISVYTVKNNLMRHTPNADVAYFLGDLEWYTIWIKTGLFFQDEKKRKKFNKESICYARYTSKNSRLGLPPWLSLIRICLYFKSLKVSQSFYLSEIFFYGKGIRYLFILPALSYLLVPRFVTLGLSRIYRKLYRLPDKDKKRDGSR